MVHAYDQVQAHHYHAYRPPLHDLILGKCISADTQYHAGLDVGCGTGKSSVALIHYCNEIVGVDPSPAMLQFAIRHPKVKYHVFDGKLLTFDSGTFDLVTFAGSLFYAKSQTLVEEVVRVSQHRAKIIVYDFCVHVESVLHSLGFKKDDKKIYNYQEDFSGSTTAEIVPEENFEEELMFGINQKNLVHLLLSSTNNYNMLSREFGVVNLEQILEEMLHDRNLLKKNKISATIFASSYRLHKSR